MGRSIIAVVAGAAVLLAVSSSILFVSPFSSSQGSSAAQLRGAVGNADTTGPASAGQAGGSLALTAAAAATALTLAAAAGVSRRRGTGKTTTHYTTQVILPALQWLKSGVNVGNLQPKELVAKTIAGNDVLIGKDEKGTLFCVANLCPHIGTPMSEGADVVDDLIVCPLHGSSFSTKTGAMVDWCPTPPIIGPLTGLIVDKKNLLIFEARTGIFGGGEIEVLVDTNAKKAYEADYWKGILDAQGKNDGSYY